MTNGLLGAIVVLFGSGGVYTVGANKDLHNEVQAMRNSISLIVAHQENGKDWRHSHEARPHAKTSELIDHVKEDQGSLQARIVALELALESLSRQVQQPSPDRRRR